MKQFVILCLLCLTFRTFGQSAYGPPYWPNRWDTATDTNLINGAVLTNVPATSITGSGTWTGNVNGGNINAVNLSVTGTYTDGNGNTGNNGQFIANLAGNTVWESIQYSVTNFDTRNWTNQSAGGIFANQFTGPGSGLTALNASAISSGTLSSTLFQTGLVRLSNGTNIVGATWFNSNAPPVFTYISDDGTVSSLFLKPSEWIQGTSFTIRSANSNDTNRVSYRFP